MIKTPGQGIGNGTNGRAYVPALISPHPLGSFLPALYQEDDFAQALTAGLDGVLAPIFGSLDNFEAYLDPRLAPEDFLDWLGSWMGLVVDETWPLDRRRAFISHANELYRMRGTPKGLAAHVALFSGGEVEIEETGGTAWSVQSGGALPGSAGFALLVRVRVDDPATVDQPRLNALVAAAKPAHLTHRVEVVRKPPPASAHRTPTPRPRPAAPQAQGPPPEPPAPADEPPVQADEPPAESSA